MNDYNPNSWNALFSKLSQRLDAQDEKLALIPTILSQVRKTNGRVTRLEVIVSIIIFCAGITATAIVQHFIH